jgi:hypothetical protein
MSEYCIAVADALRARLFTLDDVEFPELESGPRLVEQACLTNPDKELPERKMFTGDRRGRNRAPSGASYSYDDHRGRHELDFARRFARKVVQESLRLTRSSKARCLVLAADRRMLGLLRGEMGARSRNGLEIRECDKEMTKLAPATIHERLAKQKLLPPCRKPGRR